MTWQTHPVTPDRFEDFADIVNASRRVVHCWCLSDRLRAAENSEPGLPVPPVGCDIVTIRWPRTPATVSLRA